MHTQTITPSRTSITASAGESFDLTVVYTADSETLPGLGLKMFFDAEKLKFQGFKAAFSQGKLATDLQPKNSATMDHSDGDAATSFFINQAWILVDGQWPGEGRLPLDLYTVSFSLAEDFSGVSRINFVGEAAENSVFESQSVEIQLKSEQVVTPVPQVDSPVGLFRKLLSFILKLFRFKG